jgi:tetratricopeptide (TPR) repeat protein
MSKVITLTGCYDKVVKRTFIAVLLLCCSTGCDLDFMKNAENMKTDARHAIEAKNYSEAASISQKMTEKLPSDYEGYFILAQAKAQVGDKNAAISALEKAIKNGLKDDEQILKNTNLDPIKSMTAYTNLMNTNFPGKNPFIENNIPVIEVNRTEVSGSVSIQEVNGKQVVRSGDVVIEIPKTK